MMSLEALLRFDEDEVARVLAVASKGEPLPVIDQLAAHADPNIFHEDIAAARNDAERRRAELEKL